MKESKKILIIVLIVIFLAISVIAAIFILNHTKNEKIEKQKEEAIINAEENFKKLFQNLEYSKNENDAITLSYSIEKAEEGKYNVDVNAPLLNIESDAAKSVNDEINNIFGQKLLDIVKKSSVYTKYNVDYISYTNEHIISLVIKSTLKEGSNPQRLMVQTYNYDLKQNKVLTLEEYIELKGLDKNTIQTQIINYIREKSTGSTKLVEQGYNIYIRDIRSEEYLIENIKSYYIGEDGKLYIVFAYGNTNFTETVDIVIYNE